MILIRECVLAAVVLVFGVSAFAQDVPGTLEVASPSFSAGAAIPRRHTADGENLSPPLTIANVPSGARELAMIADDPDAPSPSPWVHWVLYKIDPGVRNLPEGIPAQERIESPIKAMQGLNSFRTPGYRGPQPPPGKAHRYYFRVYALDSSLPLSSKATKDDLARMMKGHVLAQGELMGTYQR